MVIVELGGRALQVTMMKKQLEPTQQVLPAATDPLVQMN